MHFLVKLVLAAPASFFSAALASHAAIVLGASVSHFLTKLVLAAPASFFSAALASQAAVTLVPASVSHFLTKLVFAAPASFFSVALASQLLMAPPAIAPLAAMPGASLWELANAEVEIARVKAAARVISCFMNVSEGWSKPRDGRGSRRDWSTRRPGRPGEESADNRATPRCVSGR